jgi:hypothetical protein
MCNANNEYSCGVSKLLSPRLISWLASSLASYATVTVRTCAHALLDMWQRNAVNTNNENKQQKY